jgi:hypothetical protein
LAIAIVAVAVMRSPEWPLLAQSRSPRTAHGRPLHDKAAIQRTRTTVKRGAPFGNKNALKHGKRTREIRALRAAVRAHILRGRALVATVTPPFSGAKPAAPQGQDSQAEVEGKGQKS